MELTQPATILINGNRVGIANVKFFTVSENVHIKKNELDDILAKHAIQEVFDAYQQLAIDPDGYIDMPQLNHIHVSASFDRSKIKLNLVLDSELMREQVISWRSRVNSDSLNSNLVIPATVSSILNLTVSGGWGRDISNQSNLESPLSIGYHNVTSLGGWVFQTVGTYASSRNNNEGSFQVNRINTTQYYPDNGNKLILGEVGFPSTGFLNPPDTLGAVFLTDKEMALGADTAPALEQRIVLKQNSQITIYLNGSLFYSKTHGSGSYRFTGIPMISGKNSLEIVIVPPDGNKQTIKKIQYFYPTLLDDKTKEYAVGMGLPYTRSGSTITTTPGYVLSGIIRHGIDPSLTLANYAYTNSRSHLVGTSGTWAFEWGVLTTDIGKSFHDDQTGMGVQFNFINFFTPHSEKHPYFAGLAIQLNYTQKGFSSLENVDLQSIAANDTYAVSIASNYAIDPAFQINLNLQVQSQDNDINLRLLSSTTKRIGNSMNLTGYAAVSTTRTGLQYSLSMTYNWKIPDSPLDILINRNPGTQSTSLQGSYTGIAKTPINSNITISDQFTQINGAASLAGINTNFTYAKDHGVVSHRASALLNSDKGRINFQYDNVEAPDRNTHRHSLGYTINTAILFADMHFGVSDHVQNNFVLFIPTQELNGNPVKLQNGSTSTLLGSVAQTDMSLYRESQIAIDVSEYPLEINVAPPNYSFSPRVGAGYVVKVGLPPKIVVSGTIFDQVSSTTIPMALGEVRPINGRNDDLVQFFTGNKGKFEIMGLSPGRYVVTLVGGGYKPTEIEIPANTKTRYTTDIYFIPIED